MADTQAKKFLDDLWAESGDRVGPAELDLDRVEGWDVRYEQLGVRKYPERQLFNQLIRELQGYYNDCMKFGILPWDNEINYAQHAFVSEDGHIWWAQVATGPDMGNPSRPGSLADTIWRLY